MWKDWKLRIHTHYYSISIFIIKNFAPKFTDRRSHKKSATSQDSILITLQREESLLYESNSEIPATEFWSPGFGFRKPGIRFSEVLTSDFEFVNPGRASSVSKSLLAKLRSQSGRHGGAGSRWEALGGAETISGTPARSEQPTWRFLQSTRLVWAFFSL